MTETTPRRRMTLLLLLLLFGIGFAYVESAVVVYLRALIYPEGFTFPLRPLSSDIIAVESAREAATIVVLAVAAFVAGSGRWERFGYFLFVFGVWDLFYYLWLKVLIGWPSAFTEWDVLFLIPLPWIGPVIAPVLVASMMLLFGILIIHRLERGKRFRPDVRSWLLSIVATGFLLYSFTADLPATLGGEMPEPYLYWMLGAGLLLYGGALFTACLPSADASS